MLSHWPDRPDRQPLQALGDLPQPTTDATRVRGATRTDNRHFPLVRSKMFPARRQLGPQRGTKRACSARSLPGGSGRARQHRYGHGAAAAHLACIASRVVQHRPEWPSAWLTAQHYAAHAGALDHASLSLVPASTRRPQRTAAWPPPPTSAPAVAPTQKSTRPPPHVRLAVGGARRALLGCGAVCCLL